MGQAVNVQECKNLWFCRLVKRPLMYSIFGLLGHYPEPKRENCYKPNTLTWLDIRDDFLRTEKNDNLWKLAKIFFDLIICEYEHDPPYEERINLVLGMLVKAVEEGKMKLRDHPVISRT